ncbi:MAG: hypothetical protein Phog2KO_41780 [Phototrophicaceae bacterium]
MQNLQALWHITSAKSYSYQKQAEVKRTVLERSSLRGLVRIFAMSRQTISYWLKKWLAQVPIWVKV